MVSDKSQVRSTGAVMAVTRQPVKGRKKHGGIRLGEMERDSLLSHGVAFCLHDRSLFSAPLIRHNFLTTLILFVCACRMRRLMNCSDSHVGYVCNGCGGLLSVQSQSVPQAQLGRGNSLPVVPL